MGNLEKSQSKKILVIRLSSLGDVILSTAGLNVLPQTSKVDWLVSAEFAGLLNGHPKINRVWSFDRRKSLFSDWIRLGISLRSEGYGQVIDLHRNLRTRILKWILIGTPWVQIAKPRWKRWGLFLFKNHWPNPLHPTRWIVEFNRVLLLGFQDSYKAADLNQSVSTDLMHLLLPNVKGCGADHPVSAVRQSQGKVRVCVMPDSAWEGKCWPVEKFCNLFESLPEVCPVVLGTRRDQRSLQLLELLQLRGVEHEAALGLPWEQVAQCISRSRFLIGNDTGLTHLAESLGIPVIVLFGPTSPSLGFSPWREQSRIVEANLGCRPCSSDGRGCYWVGDRRYQCMKELSVEAVRGACLSLLQSVTDDQLGDQG